VALHRFSAADAIRALFVLDAKSISLAGATGAGETFTIRPSASIANCSVEPADERDRREHVLDAEIADDPANQHLTAFQHGTSKSR
jgi:phage-related baseplate assembly protein